MAGYGTISSLTATPASPTVGQSVRIAVTVIDAIGSSADPATLTLTIGSPDGTSTPVLIGGMTRTATGVYTYTYDPPIAGDYSLTVITTVPDAAASLGFTVDPGSSGYLTVDELKAWPTGLDLSSLGSTGPGSDLQLAAVIRRASAWADRICHLPVGAFAQLPQTETHRATPNRCGELSVRLNGTSPNLPVTVTAVSWGARPSTLTALGSLTDVWVDGGHVTIPFLGYTGSWVGSLNVWGPAPGGSLFVQVGYTSGWTAPPDDLKQAVAFLASALIITPDADSAATPFPGAAARADGTAKSADVDYLDSAERILGFYARRTP